MYELWVSRTRATPYQWLQARGISDLTQRLLAATLDPAWRSSLGPVRYHVLLARLNARDLTAGEAIDCGEFTLEVREAEVRP